MDTPCIQLISIQSMYIALKKREAKKDLEDKEDTINIYDLF